MTVRAPMINGNTDSAETFRLALSGLWVPNSANNVRTGLTSTPVLTGTGNFTATVGPFTAIIDGTSNSLQGAYPVSNDAAATVTIGAANTQPRIDLISLQIQDNNYDGSGQLRGTFVVTAGTPSGSPVAPSAPANCIPLWTVPVAANATSITWASATAAYQRTAAAGGIVPVGVATDKPPVVNGVQYRHRLDVTAAAGSNSPLESSTDGTNWSPVFDASVVPASTTTGIINAINGQYGSWTNITLSSGWTAFRTPQWRTVPGGYQLRGSAAPTSSITTTLALWTGGPGFNAAQVSFMTINAACQGYISISSGNGTVYATTTINSGAVISFDNILFSS